MSALKGNYNKEKFEKTAYIFKSVAHPVRLGVINFLAESGRLTVNELCAKTGCEQSLLSHHLANMKANGFLESKREGQNIFYSIKPSVLVDLIGCLDKCEYSI